MRPETKENAKKLSYEFRNRNQAPLTTAIWWAEHVAATGGAPLLKSHSIYMPAFAFYSLDAYAIVFIFVIVCILCVILILKKIFGHKERNTIESKSKLQ